jgi:uncharacterized protein YjbI with pentapeptide repeats
MADDGNQQRKHDFRSPIVFLAIGVVVTLVLAAGVVIALLRTGDPQAVSDNAPLIAAVLALSGVGTAQMVGIALEDRRAQETRKLEAQRAAKAALQNYFEEVGELLIKEPLRRARPGDNLSTVVRAQTLAVLEGLDPERKRILLQFLYEAGLIRRGESVISLRLANLNGVNLREAHLNNADLRGANLRGANLNKASLHGADLTAASMSGAELREANLGKADLEWVKLHEAKLRGAYLREANLRQAGLYKTDLAGADLIHANLCEAYLVDADLSDTDLGDADLKGTHLNNANLRNAGVFEEQLQETWSLRGAIMPDGSKHP